MGVFSSGAMSIQALQNYTPWLCALILPPLICKHVRTQDDVLMQSRHHRSPHDAVQSNIRST